jgi:hypothetical protein
MMEKQFYYEFNENEYYGLIAVSVDEHDLKTTPYKKAAEIYVKNIGGESVEELLEEALPNLRTLEYALATFLRAPNVGEYTAEELIKEFENTKNGVLLVDSALM